jgi:hypothetical protein
VSSREEHLKELVLQTQELYEEYVERGRQLEQERIIGLLEQHTGYGDDEQDEYFTDAIALIKGDNK